MSDPPARVALHTRAIIRGRKPKAFRPRKIVAGDCETSGLGGPFLLGAILPETATDPLFFDDPADMVRAFVRKRFRGYRLIMHNADYDLRYLLPPIRDLTADGFDCQIVANGVGKIVSITIRRARHVWYIQDSYSLMPVPLVDLHRLAGVSKLDIGLSSGVIFDPLDPRHRDYLANDVRLLLRAYKAFEVALFRAYGVLPSITIGATAIKVFAAILPRGVIYYRQRAQVEAAGYESFFGGLTWVRSTDLVPDCVKIDVNGMYAAAMRAGVPVGSGTRTRSERDGYPGIYYCQVEATPAVTFPFVPMRADDQSVRWPGRGTWYAWLATNTIAAARRSGYLVRVDQGYYFEGIGDVFGDFVDRCERLELEFAGLGVRDVAKLLRNNLYGKLAQRPVRREFYLTATPEFDMTPVIDEVTGEMIDDLFYREVRQDRGHIMPVWAGWITSTARIMLADGVAAIGAESCVYGDTDSIICRKAAADRAIAAGGLVIGRGYGEWKVEGRYTEFRALAPKLYVGRLRDVPGAAEVKSKGVRRGLLSVEDMIRLRPGDVLSVEDIELPSAIRSLMPNVATRIVTKRLQMTPANPFPFA